MRELIALVAYLYVFVIYVTYFSLQDNCHTFLDGFISAFNFMISLRSVFYTFLVGLPVYFLSYFSVWLALLLGFCWVYFWSLKIKLLRYD